MGEAGRGVDAVGGVLSLMVYLVCIDLYHYMCKHSVEYDITYHSEQFQTTSQVQCIHSVYNSKVHIKYTKNSRFFQ